MSQMSSKYSYFASDFHLGFDEMHKSRDREEVIVSWLKSIQANAKSVFLVGDIFDYWFEYKYVIPKGYSRMFGQLAEMCDEGIDIHFFKGNHDMWVFEYFEKEIGLKIHDNYYKTTLDKKVFYITHGDGLGEGDRTYTLIKKILRNTFAQWVFSCLHPSLGIPLMKKMSNRSRKNEKPSSQQEAHDSIVNYAEELSKFKPIDYFICGHHHNSMIKLLSNQKTHYCNLGDWIQQYTYAVWNGEILEMKKYVMPAIKPS